MLEGLDEPGVIPGVTLIRLVLPRHGFTRTHRNRVGGLQALAGVTARTQGIGGVHRVVAHLGARHRVGHGSFLEGLNAAPPGG